MYPPTERILVFSTLDAYGTKRLLPQLRSQHRGAHITLLTPTKLLEDFAGLTSVDRLYKYDRKSGILQTGIGLLRSLRRERFDLFVIMCQDVSKADHMHNLVLFSLCIPCQRRVLLDLNMVFRDIGYWRRFVSLLNHAMLPVTVSLASVMTLIILTVSSTLYPSHLRYVRRSRPGRVAVLLPVLPDVSHTFIYREVLAMKRLGAEFVTVALEAGDPGVLHPEARALQEETVYLPEISQTKYLWLYLYFLIRHPMRLSHLMSMYRSRKIGGRLLFLDLNQFHNTLHPLKGIVLAWELRKRGTSYMHIYGSTYPTTRGLVASFLLDVPFSISTFVDFDYYYEFKMLREKAELARFIVVVTRFCKDRIRSYTSEEVSRKIRVIHTGIDPNYDSFHSSTDEPRMKESPKIVAIGRFVEKKGFEYLVKACALLKSRGLPIHCIIIGEGPEREKLRSLIETLGLRNQVELLGPIPNDQVARTYMKPQNILVAPSVYAGDGERDGIPTVLFEAMISRMPVISTTVSGIPELVIDGENGLLVPERDERALAGAMEKLLKDTNLRERLRRNARERVLRDFVVDKNAERLWSMIKSELQEPTA